MEGLSFNLEQLSLLHRCLRRSEDLVSAHFAIPALPSKQYPYEVVTAADLSAAEQAEGAFAHLAIYERPRPNGKERLYRICLQDAVILHRLTEDGLDNGSTRWLGCLFVYVISHELVHVVRFQRAEHEFESKKRAREIEEDLVHHITLELLQRQKEEGWERLSQLYGNPIIKESRL
jgi:hypothetical protein